MFTSTRSASPGPAEALKPHRSLKTSATTNRPHCLYRRPAIRQPRKAAHDRDNPVRLTKAKCLNRVNDLASNAPRLPRR